MTNRPKDEASSIHRGVSVVVAVLVAALWLALASWSLSERRRHIENSEARLRQLTTAVTEQTLRLFKLTETSFLSLESWLRRNPDPFPGENPEFVALAAQLHRLSGGVVEFRYVDPAGGLFLIPSPSREPAGHVGERDNIRIQYDPATRGFHISDPVVSPVGGRWAVPVTSPALRPGGGLAVMAGVIDLDHVTQLFEAQRLKPRGSITLIKTSGTTLFRAPAIAGSIGRSIAESRDFAEHFNVAESGVYHIDGAYDGVERIVSFAKLADYGLIIATTTTVDDALVPWRREAALVAGGTVLVTALLLLLLRRLLAETRKAEAARRDREQEIISILDTSTVGVLFIDRAGTILRANTRLAEMLGWPLAELVGSSYFDHVAEAERAEAMARIEAHYQGQGEEISAQRHYRRRDGSTFWGQQSGRRMLDGRGEAIGLVGVVADISERRAYETALEAKSQELERLNRDLKASNDELEVFAYVASHDLREPLRMISSYLSLIERRYGRLLDADGLEFLRFAGDGARRMDRLVLGLLDFARVERRGEPLVAMPLGAALTEALADLRMAVADAGAEIEVAPALHGAMVLGDLHQVSRLFQNLIGNAVKYRAEGRPPVVRVSAVSGGDGWTVAVADNGIGVAPEHFERIFGIFQRLHARDQYDGTGIGLAVARKIVERHRGRIWVESEVGRGTTFRFTLPAAP
jgi:PAS domain S-box-containing protein